MSTRSNPAVILPVAGLIILGGLGFSVITEMFDNLRERVRRQRARRLSLHTKTALITTAILLLVGTYGFWVLESDNLLRGTNLTSMPFDRKTVVKSRY